MTKVTGEDYIGYTSIRELELSLRSQNCLMRAGIYGVEALRTMSDEELLQIRNFSTKNLAEVRQKLADFRR